MENIFGEKANRKANRKASKSRKKKEREKIYQHHTIYNKN